MNYYIGVDNGGTISKAALFDSFGREIASASRPVKIIIFKEGWSERDAIAMWLNTADAIKETIEKSGIDSKEIKGVGCTGHGNGLYAIDEKGKPVRNFINSSDRRAKYYIDQWKKNQIDKQALPYTTQSIWAAQPNALLAWLKDHEPETYLRIDTIFMAKDWIRYCLTGERYAEITDMSGSSLMNVVEGKYDPEILNLFGIGDSYSKLPPLIESSIIAGRVTSEAAKLTGLSEGTLVAGGMFDIDACALASGILDSSPLSIVAGTWGNNQYIAHEPLIDEELFMTSRYSIPGWFLMLEGSPTSAGNLEWLISTIFSEERKSLKEDFFKWLNNLVGEIDPVNSSLLFLPFLYGCNNGNLRGGFYGFHSSHGRAEMALAVYEGVVFSHLYHIERLSKFRDYPSSIRLTGGAAKSDVWCQVFADCIGVPVEIPKGSELGALGAAISASVVVGDYSDIPQAVKKMTSIERSYLPNINRTALYRAKYEEYKKLIDALNKM